MLDSGGMTGYETTARMNWDIRADSWHGLPVAL
jgi:hypothetical protein